MILHVRLYSANTTYRGGRWTDTGLCVWRISLQASFRSLLYLQHLGRKRKRGLFLLARTIHSFPISYSTTEHEATTRLVLVSVLLLFQLCLSRSFLHSLFRVAVLLKACFLLFGRNDTVSIPRRTVLTRRKRDWQHGSVGFR